MRNSAYLTIFLFGVLLMSGCSEEWKVEPLAGDHSIIYRSEDPQNIYTYTPGLAVCPGGRIVAVFELGGRGAAKAVSDTVSGSGKGFVYVSNDNGQSWNYRTNFPIVHARPFIAGDSLYILGHHKGHELRIMRSDDRGDTWSEPVFLSEGERWHASATNVWYKDDFVYMVMEKRTRKDYKGWFPSELAPILMRGNVKSDLTKRKNWTFSSEMTFCEAVDDKQLEWFGMPFYEAFYPNKKTYASGRTFHAPGWLEGNVAQITDPKHYFYDPQGKTFHIWLRCHTGVTNIACMIKAVEKDDGTIEAMFETAPSGKKMVFVPFPGGHLRFHIVYDEETELYWLLSTQSTDSMTRPEMLGEDRHNLAYNQRQRMQLHFSKNMFDWCFAGLVAVGPAEYASRHYASMVIKDDDLLILSRSGDLDARDAHNGNIITFHRVKDFRRLVY